MVLFRTEASPSIRPWSPGSGSLSNSSIMHLPPSICGSRQSEGWRTRRRIAGPERRSSGWDSRVKGAKRLGMPVDNWLSAEQGKRLLRTVDVDSLRGKRDYATLAILLGCGLRRAELTALRVEDIQQREEHWVIADLIGKGGQIRTIPVPDWVKAGIDAWMMASGIVDGILLRSINKAGRVMPHAALPSDLCPSLSSVRWRTGEICGRDLWSRDLWSDGECVGDR